MGTQANCVTTKTRAVNIAVIEMVRTGVCLPFGAFAPVSRFDVDKLGYFLAFARTAWVFNCRFFEFELSSELAASIIPRLRAYSTTASWNPKQIPRNGML